MGKLRGKNLKNNQRKIPNVQWSKIILDEKLKSFLDWMTWRVARKNLHRPLSNPPQFSLRSNPKSHRNSPRELRRKNSSLDNGRQVWKKEFWMPWLKAKIMSRIKRTYISLFKNTKLDIILLDIVDKPQHSLPNPSSHFNQNSKMVDFMFEGTLIFWRKMIWIFRHYH